MRFCAKMCSLGKNILAMLRKNLEGMTSEERDKTTYKTYWAEGLGSTIGVGFLQPLARAYFSAPATSVSSERA